MPVTIASTGTFNGASTSAPAGLAAASAAGSAITRNAPAAGDNCATNQYGTGTQASAFTSWDAITGRTIQVWRTYFSGVPPSSITADLQTAATNGIAVAMSFKPTLATTSGGGNSADRSTINSFLASCASFGLVAMCAMYHEPAAEIGNANTYGFTQAYYGPTVRQYYPLVYGGQCGNFTNGNLTTYENYFNTAVTAGAGFDAAVIDYYANGYVAGTRLDTYAAFTDSQGLASFGLWECGLDESVVSQANGTAYWQYLASFFAARAAAGKGVGYITHFSLATPDGTAGFPFSGTDYQIALYDALYDAVG